MKIVETYIVSYEYKLTLLYKTDNDKWFINRRLGNVGYDYLLTGITEEVALSLIRQAV